MATNKFDNIFQGVQKLVTELDKLTVSLKKVDMELEKPSTGNKLTKQQKELNSVNTQAIKIGKEKVRIVNQAYTLNKKAEKEADKATASMNRHNVAVKEQIKLQKQRIAVEERAKLKVASGIKLTKAEAVALQRVNKEYRTKQKLLSATSSGYKNLTAQIKKNNVAIKQSRSGLSGLGKGFKQLIGRAAAFVGIFGVIRLFGNMIKTFVKFEKASKRLKAITGSTAKQMKVLTNQAKQLGATTAFTASQVLELQTELGKLGFSSKQIEASTKGILGLAAATGSTLTDAATLAGSAVRIFGLTAEETGRVTDVLALSTSKSALDMQKLATALPIVGTTAKQAGLSIEQTTGLLATLADRGIDASTAGTSLRMIFIQLAKKGLTYNEAMEMINNSTNKTKTAVELFGARAATAATVLSGTTAATADLVKELNNASGAAKEMADIMLDNLAGDITKAKSAWEGFVLSVEDGEGGIGKALRSIISSFTKVLNKITELNNVSKVMDERYGDRSFWDKLTGSDAVAQLFIKRLESIKNGFEDLTDSEQINRIKLLQFQTKELIKRLANAKTDDDIKSLKTVITLYTDYTKELILTRVEKTKLNEVTKEGNKEDGKTNTILKEQERLLSSINRIKGIKETARGAVPDQLDTGKPISDGARRDAYLIEAFNRTEETARNAANTMMARLKNVLFGEGGTFLSRLFGGGENGEAAAQLISDQFSQLFETISQGVEDDLARLDTLIDRQNDAISNTQDLLIAEKASIDQKIADGQAYDTNEKQRLQKQLAADKKQKADLLKQEKEAKRKQQKLEVAAAFVQVAGAVAKAYNTPPPGNIPLAIITGILGAIQIGTIKKQQYATGTQSVSLNGNPQGVDTVPAMLTAGEGVITKQINTDIPYDKGFTHAMIPAAANMYLNRSGNHYYAADMSTTEAHLEDIKYNTSDRKGIMPDGSHYEYKGRTKYIYS